MSSILRVGARGPIAVAIALSTLSAGVFAAKTTECAKVGICYCVNEELKPTIAQRIEKFRALIADQRKAPRRGSAVMIWVGIEVSYRHGPP